ncbi:hypothetical protein PMAC_000189 [Pneumocystis sp. 'macacae']|nr:hypothetical protein PMAC_000189 [Pneumocystis sp. 'macacae']
MDESMVYLTSDNDKSKNDLKDKIQEEKVFRIRDVNSGNFSNEENTYVLKKEEKYMHSLENTSQFQKIKQDSSNKRKLTKFVSTIINNVKHAWIRAKSDYQESLKRRNRRLLIKKYARSHPLRQQKNTAKMKRRAPFPKKNKEAVSEKAVHEAMSNASTFSTTFQSCTEWLPTDPFKVRGSHALLETLDKENNITSSETLSVMNQQLEISMEKSLEVEAIYCEVTSLKEELEEARKRLEMFEKKYGLFEDLFVKAMDNDLKTCIVSETENYAMNNIKRSSLDSSQKEIVSENDPYVFDSNKNRELDDDPSLEILSPVVLQNKSYSYNLATI